MGVMGGRLRLHGVPVGWRAGALGWLVVLTFGTGCGPPSFAAADFALVFSLAAGLISGSRADRQFTLYIMGFRASWARRARLGVSGSATRPVKICAGIGKMISEDAASHNLWHQAFTTKSRHTCAGI
jgi:hypothetical protein